MRQQKSISLKVSNDSIVYSYFKKGNFSEKSNKNEYVAWSFIGCNISVIYYKSGKLVLQGEEVKVSEFKKEVLQLENKKLELDVIGCDEAGKGEFLGPLTLGIVYLDKNYDIAKTLQDVGVQDSKNITKSKILQLAEKIQQTIEFYKVEVIEPEILNKLWDEKGNISIIMSEKYSDLIKSLCEKGVDPKKIIVDQYTSRTDRLEGCLGEIKTELVQIPKGEKYLAVAAASILARAEYLKWMEKLNLQVKEAGYEKGIPWGYGNHLMKFGKWYIKEYGQEEFRKIAKSFFKTMKKF